MRREVLATIVLGRLPSSSLSKQEPERVVAVVVRLTVVVVSVGGGVLTTSSLAQAPETNRGPMMSIRRDNVFIFS